MEQIEKGAIGRRIKDAREALGLSQAELGGRLTPKKKQSYIANIETGYRDQPRELLEIAEALGVRALWLKTGKGPKHYGNQLSPDEQTIIDAFRRFDDDRKDEWLYAARKKLRDEESVKNAA